jgi:hypothetical protein
MYRRSPGFQLGLAACIKLELASTSITMSFLDKLFRKKVLPGRLVEEEGFLDIDLPLTAIATGSAGEIRFIARGEISGKDVGFSVVLQPEWDAQPIEDGSATFYWGMGAYERTGPESDRFVELVAQYYGLHIASCTMLPSVSVQVVGLDSDPSKAMERGAKMKFFFHSASEDAQRYAEVFTNINIEEGLLEFHEKDNEYRPPLIRALSEA